LASLIIISWFGPFGSGQMSGNRVGSGHKNGPVDISGLHGGNSVWCEFVNEVFMFVSQDSRITDAANEAKDNLKYLSTLDKFFSPLSKSDPVTSYAYCYD